MKQSAGDLVDISQVQGCTCLRLRRATRQVTRLYDRALEPADITVTQFGILAHLHCRDDIAMGTLADWIGMDPTTLSRTLKPLLARDWIRIGADPEDRRIRAIRITEAGRAKLREAIPMWSQAQQTVETIVGRPTVLALNGLLDLSAEKIGV